MVSWLVLVVEPGGGGKPAKKDRLLGGPVRRCSLASTTPLAVPGSKQESGVNLVFKRLMRQLGQITKGHHHE
jgi:hypothetical protein